MSQPITIRVEATDPTPPSDQIKQQIAHHIRRGDLAENERLPAVRQLAKDLGVAAGTVARAYKALESEGLVITRRGAGTRPAPQNSATTPHTELADAAMHLAAVAQHHGHDIGDALAAVRDAWRTSSHHDND